MNYAMIRYIIGWILNFEAAFMSPSFVVGLIYREKSAWAIFATMLLCLVIGVPMVLLKRPKQAVFYAKDGFVSVGLSWVALSVMGALPFVISGSIPHPVDALFETVSGFTTTGSSILSDVEALPKCMLFWRSFTHWVGGMGVLVFMLTILPMSGGYHMNLMRAESPGPSVERFVPTVKSTAKILYGIYICLSLLELLLLLVGKMPMFDALTLTFGTAGTGGFGIKNDSIGSYTTYQQTVITIFMILFGVNFNVYFLFLLKKIRQGLKNEELRAYLGIILGAILLITVNIAGKFGNPFLAFHHAAFQVGSIITTTGYSTVDFNTWPTFSKTVLVLLMFIGASAGSTGGGIKVSRIVILAKSVKKELKQYLHPHSISKIKMDGKPVEHEVVRSINVFLIAYLLIYAVSILIVSLDNFDFTTTFTSVAATINNIGPGLDLVGPAANFGILSVPSKLVLIFDMLAGRLEIFPLLLLFVPDTWRKF
ncbi:TrkH family potassium uptake protein [Fusicatenibacter faecihominis]|uniref:TrkH family potassium uptake protein n=1 Tax=Fusicatenibacter faecihominis TaxID=2881276 RepID=A0AAE3DQN9_9FIRM|nr:TrkH family potassium uptake protein [Fusicatenibacter faecihominis]MCC2188825.1 TrkH family potassium uptake protein [Fusicatenibacter faecihominis]